MHVTIHIHIFIFMYIDRKKVEGKSRSATHVACLVFWMKKEGKKSERNEKCSIEE